MDKHSRVIDGQRCVWDVPRLWALAAALPVVEVPVADVAELDRDCWFGDDPPTVRAVAEHCRQIVAADLRWPIILNADGTLMDGGHRLARAILDGRTHVAAVRFPALPAPDRIVAERPTAAAGTAGYDRR